MLEISNMDYRVVNGQKTWLTYKEENQVECIIDVAQIRTIKRYECKVCEGRGLRAKYIKKEKTIIEYLNGDEIILNSPISNFLEPLGINLDNC